MQLTGNGLIIVGATEMEANEIYIWDVKEQKSLVVGTEGNLIQGVRIVGDGSKFFTMSRSEGEDWSSIQAWSIGTGECMGKVVLEDKQAELYFDPLCLDGSKVGVVGGCPQVWDFGVQGIIPFKSPGMASDRLYPEIIVKAYGCSYGFYVRIENKSTKKVFPLPDRYACAPVLQWDGQYVIAGYNSGEVLILDLNNMSS